MKAILLDRDETLNEDPGYLNDPEKVILKPGVVSGLAALRNAGFEFFVMTNQSGVARGLISQDQLRAVNDRISRLLAHDGLTIRKFYICPHGEPIMCECRKPRPGLFLEFFREFRANPAECFAIGDKLRDIAAAESSGVRGILLGTADMGAQVPPKNLVYTAQNFQDAADYIIALEKG
ncbi:MAG: HAD family hydrolase [Leptospirales bacterium]|nr:HAD family hydrolase [Leptospirales bacterium]